MTIHHWSKEEYHSHKALSAGMAWKMVSDCPAQAYYESVFNPERPTLNHHALDIGTATHLAVLESHLFAERCCPIEADSYRTQAAREARAEAWARGVTPLLPSDYQLVQRLRDALYASPAAELLFGAGENEVSFTWDFADVRCKGRADRVVPQSDHTLIVDVKTAPSASPEAFARAMLRDGHHLRAAFYSDGWLDEVPTQYLFVVVAKIPPHLVAVYRIGERSFEWGRRLYRKALKEFRECEASSTWPGYSREPVTSIELPTYGEHALADLEATGEL